VPGECFSTVVDAQNMSAFNCDARQIQVDSMLENLCCSFVFVFTYRYFKTVLSCAVLLYMKYTIIDHIPLAYSI